LKRHGSTFSTSTYCEKLPINGVCVRAPPRARPVAPADLVSCVLAGEFVVVVRGNSTAAGPLRRIRCVRDRVDVDAWR
jgi:hypothetical protein